MELRRIVYATDFSGASATAFPTAVELARRFDARLDSLHVLERLADVLPVTGGMAPGETALDRRRITAEARLRQWVEDRAPEGLDVHSFLEEGDAADGIVRFAGGHGADLIVMGLHGHSAVERFFLGSVTEAVLRRAPCAVLAVPGRPRES